MESEEDKSGALVGFYKLVVGSGGGSKDPQGWGISIKKLFLPKMF